MLKLNSKPVAKAVISPSELAFSMNNANHKLYHSPIKLSETNEGTQGSQTPFSLPHTPKWSPATINSILGSTGKDSFEAEDTTVDQPSPDLPPETANQLYPYHKQRIISPSSSNERTDDDSNASSAKSLSQPQPPPPTLFSQPPPPPVNYPTYPPYYHHYAPHPTHLPQWGYPVPPPPPPSKVGPPPPFSYHCDPQPQAHETTCEYHFVRSTNRCVPLKPPVPTRSWAYVSYSTLPLSHTLSSDTTNTKLPDFSRIVNYPDFLSRGRQADRNKDGRKHCVMCGQMRVCSSGFSGRRSKDAETTHIIPRQNKGVCTACDVTVWVMVESRLEIKWCKGCKNFRPWAGFGEKGLATKCTRCRQRQKEKYATQKGKLRNDAFLTE